MMSGGSAVTIRPARPDDLAPVADVFLACWRESYAGFLPEHVIRLYDEAGARKVWQPAILEPAADTIVLVAEAADAAKGLDPLDQQEGLGLGEAGDGPQAVVAAPGPAQDLGDVDGPVEAVADRVQARARLAQGGAGAGAAAGVGAVGGGSAGHVAPVRSKNIERIRITTQQLSSSIDVRQY